VTLAALPTRRREELDAKLKSLALELGHWMTLTDSEKTGLRRHHSQVRRLAAALEGLLEKTRGEVDGLAAGSPAVLDHAVTWENDILAAHSIWEIFRSKLVLRQDEWFRTRLAAADDLAWECYRPALAAFAPDAKTPPLVYLTSTWSPFAKSRDASFQNEIRATSGTSGALTGEAFQSVLKRLPIPLIGLPWYQAFYVPGTILVAHEVGHVVEWDFDLTKQIGNALTAAKLEHHDVWSGWASEVFADLYGCLAMGPAFVGALIDLLSDSKLRITTEERAGGKYPTRALRIELALRTLVETHHDTAAQRLRNSWEDTYGAMATMTDYLADADKVVTALTHATFNGKTLSTVLSFPHSDSDVETTADRAAQNYFDEIKALGPRELFAAAQWLHERPAGVNLEAAYDLLIRAVGQKGANEYRFRGAPVAEKRDFDAELAKQEAADREAGRQLRKILPTVAVETDL
jgi:hypothetical protein